MASTCALILCILVVFLSLLYSWYRRVRGYKVLPGPFCLPVVGYLPFMTNKPYLKLTKLANSYGPLYKIRLGSLDVVVVTDFKIMREALSKDSFFGRPALPLGISPQTIKTDAFLGLPWKEQRRFTLHQLKDLGFGKSRLEALIKQEIGELLELLTAESGQPIHVASLLTPSMSNNVASLIFGSRMSYADPRRRRLDFLISRNGRLSSVTRWQQFFPWLRILLRKIGIGGGESLAKSFEEIRDFCRDEIVKHETSLDRNNIRDFIDGYLVEIEKRKQDPESPFRKEVLTDLSRMFFGAGTHTGRIVVEWVLLLCAENRQMQRRMQKEIDEVLGFDDFPEWQDRLRMPYTDSLILEAMRWRTILPLNIMRCALEDTELNGYHIPKNTQLLSVLWAVDHDESLWGPDANDFRPERFLSEDEKKVIRYEHFIPFSIGKRSCPGKPMGEIEVFLYVVAILQKFNVSFPPGVQGDFDGVLGIGLQPKKQELCFKLRRP